MGLLKRKPYILVIRQLGGIGDVLALSCVFRGLKETYGNRYAIKYATARIYLSGALYEIAQRIPYVDEIICIEPYEACTDRMAQCYPQHYGGSPSFEGLALYRQASLVFDLNTVCAETEHSEITRFGTVTTPRYKIWCNAAGVVPSSYRPAFELTDEDRAKAAEYVASRGWPGKDKLVGVGVNSVDMKRSLKVPQTKSICDGLRSAGLFPVTIDSTFSFDDYPAIRGMRISEVMAIIEHMGCMVSADSGLLHMAGTLDVPVVGIFGPTNQAMRMKQYRGSAIDSSQVMACAPCWYSYPCLKDPDPRGHIQCLRSLNPDTIIEETLRWMKGTYAAPASFAGSIVD